MTEIDMSLHKNVGAIFKSVREAAGLSQREAAAKADSTQARISYLENGSSDVMLSTLERWATAYGYDLEINLVLIEDEATKKFNDALAEALAATGD